jgi:hypothetical protein
VRRRLIVRHIFSVDDRDGMLRAAGIDYVE